MVLMWLLISTWLPSFKQAKLKESTLEGSFNIHSGDDLGMVRQCLGC